jgi:hypothetical protein
MVGRMIPAEYECDPIPAFLRRDVPSNETEKSYVARKPRKAKDIEAVTETSGAKEAAPAANGIGHNSRAAASELTDDQRARLFFAHKTAYEAALAVKKKADADFKKICKLAKSELGDDAVPSIKDALLLETEEGTAQIEADRARQARVARWMAVPLGAQPDLFGDERMPAVDRARAEGKAARLQGKPAKSPYDPSVPQHDAFLEGYADGNRALIEGQKRDDAVLFDQEPPPVGDQPATEAVH